MSLFGALQTATSGLAATQAGIAVVSQNVANAGSVGYSRRRLDPVQQLSGDQTSGVRAGEAQRVLDAVAQKQLRLETSGASYTALIARFSANLDSLFGKPGETGSLDGTLNTFTTALQALASSPASSATRGAVLDAGQRLADRIGSVAEGVQDLRGEAEGRIAAAVGRVNDLVKGIARLNEQVTQAGSSNAALLDERDRLVTELSGLVDVQTTATATGAINVATTAGLSLIVGQSVSTLIFDARGALGPENRYAADGSRSVGTITARTASGATVDVVAGKLIRSGEIKAALELRDERLVAAQRQLDELASGLSRALSDRPVSGTPVALGGSAGFDLDLAGLQAGNAVTVAFQDNTATPPVARRFLLIPTSGGAPAAIDPADTADPSATVKTIDVSGSFSTLVSSIGAALGAGFSVTASGSSTVRILDDGAATAPDVTGVSAGITTMTLASGRPELPFFVDGGDGQPFTGSFEGGSHLTGLAQRLAVNPSLVSDRSRLVVYAASPATLPGDATRPQFLVDGLTQASRTFGAAGVNGTGSSVSTVADFARGIVERQGAEAEAARQLDEGQQIALSTIQTRFSDSTAVSVDQEMAQLLALQTAYGANARVMTAVRDLLDLLMRM